VVNYSYTKWDRLASDGRSIDRKNGDRDGLQRTALHRFQPSSEVTKWIVVTHMPSATWTD
jgi:hypothetical protein